MMARHERKHVELALRLGGISLLALAALVGRHLFAAADPRGKHEAICYLLALIGMASACAGAALAVLGRHLFDQVDLPSRWTIHDLRRRQD